MLSRTAHEMPRDGVVFKPPSGYPVAANPKRKFLSILEGRRSWEKVTRKVSLNL